MMMAKKSFKPTISFWHFAKQEISQKHEYSNDLMVSAMLTGLNAGFLHPTTCQTVLPAAAFFAIVSAGIVSSRLGLSYMALNRGIDLESSRKEYQHYSDLYDQHDDGKFTKMKPDGWDMFLTDCVYKMLSTHHVRIHGVFLALGALAVAAATSTHIRINGAVCALPVAPTYVQNTAAATPLPR